MRRSLTRVGLLLIVSLLGVAIGRSQTPANPSGSEDDDYAVAYAKANLELARTILKTAQQRNDKVAGVVSPELVTRYESNVKLAERRLELARSGGDAFAIFVNGLQSSRQQREDAYRRAKAARARQASTYTATEVERLRLWAELARLNLDHAETLTDAPHEQQLAWIATVVQEEIHYLQDQSDRRPYRRYY